MRSCRKDCRELNLNGSNWISKRFPDLIQMYIATSTKPLKLSALASTCNYLSCFLTKEFLSRYIVFENLILGRPVINGTNWQKEGKA